MSKCVGKALDGAFALRMALRALATLAVLVGLTLAAQPALANGNHTHIGI